MEQYQSSLETAKKEIRLSDHLFYVTFPTINELKFLVSIIEHIIKSIQCALEALLEYERYYKRVSPFPKDFDSELDLFKEKLFQRYGFDINHYRLLKRLAAIKKCNSEAIIRFKRKEKYFFTTQEQEMESVDTEDVKKFIRFGKDFIAKVEQSIRSSEVRPNVK